MDGPANPADIQVERLHSFGTVEEGPPLSHAFELRNASSRPIRIQDVRSSCGCLVVAEPGRSAIAPGETTTITAELKTANRPGFERRFVTVVTDCPTEPVFRLFLEATIERVYSIDPATVELGTLPFGVGAAARICMKKKSAREVSIGSVTTSLDPFITAGIESDGDGDVWITMSVSPAIPPGDYSNEELVAQTRESDLRLRVPIHMVVQRPICAEPVRVQLPSVPRSSGATRRITLSRRDGRFTENPTFALTLRSVPDSKAKACDAGRFVECRVVAVHETSCEIDVTVLKECPFDYVFGNIKVSCGDAELDSISLPVSVHVTEG